MIFSNSIYLHYVNLSHKSNTLNIISYNFDKQRNLLMSRNSMLTGRNTENFSYDSLGRLVRTYTPHNRQTSLVEYTTNGNIASKTGVGSYYYESSRPHAVTMVDNTDSIVSTISQYVTYTPFNKVHTVIQGDYELEIKHCYCAFMLSLPSNLQTMIYLTPTHWNDYRLIDSGNFEKLEKFGSVITRRPEPQAVWDKSLSEAEWQKYSTIDFVARSSNSGDWIKHKNIPDSWQIKYDHLNLTCNLKFTAFKHVGIFPEQAVNWDYIHSVCKANQGLKVLNLFGYTGIASIAARSAGADVTHLDSVKQVVSWTKQNMESSGQENIRWIVEDARKFVAKEIKRGNLYNGIIMDPPAFGRGTNGEDWKLERDLNALLKDVEKILDKNRFFFILNTYSLGFSAFILENLVNEIFKNHTAEKEFGELYLEDDFKKKLPLGVIARFTNLKK